MCVLNSDFCEQVKSITASSQFQFNKSNDYSPHANLFSDPSLKNWFV